MIENNANNNGQENAELLPVTPATATATSDEVVVVVGGGPSVTTHEVLQCQFSSWYKTFSNIIEEEIIVLDSSSNEDDKKKQRKKRKRKNVTIQSIIIESLPSDFMEYLLSDGVQIPVGANDNNNNNNNSASAGVGNNNNDNDSDDGWSSEEEDNNNDDKSKSSNNNNIKQFHFPVLNQQIHNAITTLGGGNGGNGSNAGVMPKLNWSSPKDATWVNGGSLKCLTPGDVYILIKSSDFCLHDVMKNSYKNCIDYNHNNIDDDDDDGNNNDNTTPTFPPLQLVLRKWCNLNPSMEFRCFVRDHELLAISQRNHTQHYPHLIHDVPHIRDKLLDFFEDYIQKRFANGTVSKYVVDIYLDQKDRAWIIDFNIFAQTTDPLLFDWIELMTMDCDGGGNGNGDDNTGYGNGGNGNSNGDTTENDNSIINYDNDHPVFRIVETAQQVRHDPLASYRAPIDTVDLANMMKGDAKEFEEFMKKQSQAVTTTTQDDDDDEKN